MSLLSFVVIGALALLSLRLFMTSRRDRKRAQLRELQQALRRNRDGDKEKRRYEFGQRVTEGYPFSAVPALSSEAEP